MDTDKLEMSENSELEKKAFTEFESIHENVRSVFREKLLGEGSLMGVIDKTIQCLEEIELFAREYVPLIEKLQLNRKNEKKEKAIKILESEKKKYEDDKQVEIGFKDLVETIYLIEEINCEITKYNIISKNNILIQSLYFNLFSTFDVFIGELLKFIFELKPNYLKSKEKALSYEEILDSASIDAIKQQIIANEIDKLRRESYVDQFITLEKKFEIQLRKFDNWPAFVECTQRRNLLMHCGGIISEQYIKICSSQGSDLRGIVAGQKLSIDHDYLINSSILFQEVSYKLGQVLWRKCFEDELEKADSYLVKYTYRLLTENKWDQAKLIGAFALSLPRLFNDTYRKLLTINYSIALNFSGDKSKMHAILNKTDWSSCIDDFKVAKLVLEEKFEDACVILKKIGKKGEYIDERAYREWPLFNNIRKDNVFQKTYQEIYDKVLTVEIKNNIENKLKDEINK